MREFFEGWYFKHQIENEVICFIPSFHRDKNGITTGSLQIIANDFAVQKTYFDIECGKKKEKFSLKIGENIFTRQGIKISFENEEIKIEGKLFYQEWTPLKTDIMGVFQYIPLECRHGIESMYHTVQGSLKINGKKIDFTDGIGYIEKDSGTSFPSSYFWSQCSWKEKNSIFLSVAKIPFVCFSFTGCICAVYYQGKEYRLATYLGVRIIKWTEKEVILKQGRYTLRLDVLGQKGYALHAPRNGILDCMIKESPKSTVRYRFFHGKKLIFDYTGTQAGVEYRKEEE